MTKRHTTIARALLVAVLLTAAGCGGGKHQARNSTSTTSADSPTTSATGNTTTTVLGPSGPPSSYPAAQATPPSLAGAYPTGNTVNLVTVLKTLTTYRDWVWSHPNPALVANYDLPSGNGYASEVKEITQLRQEDIHADPTPSEILFARVTLLPTPQAQVDGKPSRLDGYQWFHGGVLTAVYNVQVVSMLDASGQPSGQQFNPSTVGEVAYSVSLAQGSDGQFHFVDTVQLNPPGGVAAVEQQS